jgi:hypothetical protein
MFYIFFIILYFIDIIGRINKFIVESSLSLRNFAINCLILAQTLIDFLWKSVDAEREGVTIIVNKEERIISNNCDLPREKIYTFSVKESGGKGEETKIGELKIPD